MKNFAESSSYKWCVLFVVQCALFLLGIDSTIVNIALPTMRHELQIDINVAQWIISIFLVAMAITFPIAGKIADIYGRKVVFVVGLLVLAASSFFCAISSSLEFLIINRIFQGFGCAACLANCMAIVSTIFRAGRHGLALGINNSVQAMGMGIGVLLGGYLIDYFGWRSIFFVNAGFALIFAIVASIILIEKKISIHTVKSFSLDYAGIFLFVLSVSALMLGIIFFLNPIDIQWLSWILVLLGSGLLLLLLFVEMRISSPLLNLKIFKIREFLHGSVIKWINGVISNSMMFTIPFFMTEALHLSPIMTGWVILPIVFGLLIFGPFAGHFADKIGGNVITLSGFLISAVSFVFLIGFNTMAQEWLFLKLSSILFVYGISLGAIMSGNNNSIFKVIPQSEKAASSGILITITNFGGALGVAICSQMMHSKALPGQRLSSAVDQVKTNIFYFLLLLALLGALFCLFGLKKRFIKNGMDLK
ncbi:MAG: MFS transporter [Chlamydiales bacterium]